MNETRKEVLVNDVLSDETLDNVQHVNNPVLDLPTIEKKYLQGAVAFYNENQRFICTDGKAKVELTVVSDSIIRVRLAPIGVFLDDFSYAVVEQEHANDAARLSEDDTNYYVSTDNVVCIIQKKDFLVSFSDIKGKVLNQDFSPMHWEENYDYGGYYVYCTKKAFDDEVFYGCGDKATNLNL